VDLVLLHSSGLILWTAVPPVSYLARKVQQVISCGLCHSPVLSDGVRLLPTMEIWLSIALRFIEVVWEFHHYIHGLHPHYNQYPFQGLRVSVRLTSTLPSMNQQAHFSSFPVMK